MFKLIADTYRRSFTGLSTETWWLSLVMLINRSGTMVAPFLTIYLTQDLHYSLTKAGIVNAAFGLGSVLGAFLGGRLTDRIGHAKVQLAGLLGGGVFFMLLGYVHHFWAMCILTFVLAMVNDAFRPANSVAVAVHSTPENRTRSYSLNRLAVNLGWAVGASLGGILASFNYHLLFWVDGCTNILAGLVLWKVLYKANARKKQQEENVVKPPGVSPWRDGLYMRFILLVTLFCTCFMLVFRILPVYYKEDLLLPESFIGLVMGLNGIIIALFEMVLVARWEGRRNEMFYMRAGSFCMAVSFLMLLFPVNPWLLAILSMVVFTFSEILAIPFMNSFMINRAGEHNRGAYVAVYTISWSVAQIAGPYFGALVVDHFSYRALWLVALTASVLCGLGMYWLKTES